MPDRSLDTAQCPFCGAWNRPRVVYIEPLQTGEWLCLICGKTWRPDPDGHP